MIWESDRMMANSNIHMKRLKNPNTSFRRSDLCFICSMCKTNGVALSPNRIVACISGVFVCDISPVCGTQTFYTKTRFVLNVIAFCSIAPQYSISLPLSGWSLLWSQMRSCTWHLDVDNFAVKRTKNEWKKKNSSKRMPNMISMLMIICY